MFADDATNRYYSRKEMVPSAVKHLSKVGWACLAPRLESGGEGQKVAKGLKRELAQTDLAC